jgi:hypothetical protein
MRPPSWMKLSPLRPNAVHVGADGRAYADFTVTIHRWHPGFWWFVVSSLVRQWRSRP